MRLERFSVNVVAISLGLAVSSPAFGQAVCENCRERYTELAEKRRIQADIDYLTPTDALDLDRVRVREKDEPDATREGDGWGGEGPGNLAWLFISALVLLGLGFVVYQNSAGGLVAFGAKPSDATTPKRKAASTLSDKAQDDGLPQSEAAFLAQIEAMADRREALHLLAGRLLNNAAESTGIRPARSWTAREALRALPRNWAHLGDLRHLNRQAELAWFGGRHVEDSVFADCLNRARHILQTGGSR